MSCPFLTLTVPTPLRVTYFLWYKSLKMLFFAKSFLGPFACTPCWVRRTPLGGGTVPLCFIDSGESSHRARLSNS